MITGLSGSGKSSLAFDTIYAEGQRRYIETFSAYARQFLGGLERPDVDKIEGLSPVIAIEQKTTSKSPRSTVGTITEIYDFLRLLFARAGEAFSYNTGDKMNAEVNKPIIESIFYKNSPLHDGAVIISKNQIMATRVILPVSSSQNIPSRLGLRHRAALGITESTDAVCIVVSEETGEISHIREGNITIKKSPLELTQLVKEDMANI